jgi:hypothetical protein
MKIGGLGILDLEHFNRALRLRWQWQRWIDDQKSWANMTLAHSTTEQELFRVCTSVTVGDGAKASFWHDHWLYGQAPKEIAPDLLHLARLKNCTIQTALSERTWMKGLRRISSIEQIHQFVKLWSLLQQVHLVDRPYEIRWRFNTNGKYSSKSAYQVQFSGSFADFDWARLWSAKAENKCKMFCWLVLQNKLWTSDQILKHVG